MKICIVTDDIIGPVRNGGIGTAYANLAEFLAGEEHEVTIFYTIGTYCEQGVISEHMASYAKKGIKFMPSPDTIEGGKPNGSHNMVKAYRAFIWLKQQELAGNVFDVIHYHDWCAPGFFIAKARHQGLYFQKTRLICGTHAPDKWAGMGNEELPTSADRLMTYWMERKSAEWADAVVSPSQYMLDWYNQHGVHLTDDQEIRVIQNLIPESMIATEPPETGGPHRVAEIVFFGRLEARKGIVEFCDAIDELAADKEFKFKGRITFLGKEGMIATTRGAEFVAQRAAPWPWKVTVTTSFNRDQAVEYLKTPGRLAVIASRVENSPYTVLECLAQGLSFIAADVGGIRELIHPSDAGHTIYRLPDLTLALRESAKNGIWPAKMQVTQEQVRAEWRALHQPRPIISKSLAATIMPHVDVILLTRNRPNYLRQAIASLKEQTYPNYAVTVFDAGSDQSGQIKLLQTLETEFAKEARGWRVVRNQTRLWPDQARNAAVATIGRNGSYIMFMDDDNVAKPIEIETFMRVAQNTDADVVTCAMDVFWGPEPPDDTKLLARWIPLGAAIAPGAWINIFGDTNALWRHEAFLALGGFTERPGVGHEDWELYSRAVFANARLEACPDALFYYRDSENGVNKSTNVYENHLRNFSPYMELISAIHPDMADFALYAFASKYYADALRMQVSKMKRS